MIIESELKHETVTVAQMIALVRVYNRCPIFETKEHAAADIKMTFDEFVQKNVSYHSVGLNCLMVEWSGMFLGIETDGYTHS